jgi:hypothetical protein
VPSGNDPENLESSMMELRSCAPARDEAVTITEAEVGQTVAIAVVGATAKGLAETAEAATFASPTRARNGMPLSSPLPRQEPY